MLLLSAIESPTLAGDCEIFLGRERMRDGVIEMEKGEEGREESSKERKDRLEGLKHKEGLKRPKTRLTSVPLTLNSHHVSFCHLLFSLVRLDLPSPSGSPQPLPYNYLCHSSIPTGGPANE